MAVRTKAQLEAAFAALFAAGQADESITPARFLALWTDLFDSLLDDPAILQVALAANIVTSMLRNGAVTAEKMDDAVVPAGWALSTGASGRAPKAQMPSDTVYDADLDTLFSSAVGSGTSITLTRVDGATTTINFAESIRDLMASFLTGGTDISVTHDDNADTLTIAFTGTGSGSSRTDAQVQELARDAVGAALTEGTGINIAVNDSGDTITISATGGAGVSLSDDAPTAVGTEAAGTGTEASRDDHGHDYGGTIPVRNLPETLQILESEYRAGGLRLITDGSIQIAGDLQGSALASIDTGATWGSEVVRTQDTSLGANPYIQTRFRISDYPALPAASALDDIRFSPVASGDPDEPAPVGTVMAIVSRAAPSDDTSNTYHYAYVQIGIANWPAGDYVRLLRDQPTEWDLDIQPGDIVPGTNGQFMQTIGGVSAWGAPPSGGAAGTNAVLTRTQLSSHVMINFNSSALTWTPYNDVFTHTVASGNGGITMFEWGVNLSTNAPTGGTGRVWADVRVLRTRSSVDATLAWHRVYIRNFESGIDSQRLVQMQLTDDAEVGDVYKLQVRIQSQQASQQANRVVVSQGFSTYQVVVRFPTAGGGGMSGGMTGQQLTISPGNELAPSTVGLEQLTDVLRARLDPEYRINFLSGLGEHLWRFGSPAQGDSIENNNPNSSYEPLDPGTQLLPLAYDRSEQTAHSDYLTYVLSFANDTERVADARFGAGGVVDNALPMAMPALMNDESIFLFGKYVPRGSGSEPIFSIWTNVAGTTSWTLWHNVSNGRVHIAEADGTEYGSYIIPAGGGAVGQLVTYGFQADKTATGWQFALQINGVAVAMSNPSTNPSPPRVVYGYFPGTRFNGQMMVVEGIKASGAALGIPAGATGSGNTGLINPFGINVSQYTVAAGEFEYTRAWSQNLLDSPAVLVNTNEPYITLNRSFDITEREELRLDVQYYASERASVHAYLEGLTTRTLAAPNTTLVGTMAFEWERGKSPTQYYRGGLNTRTNAQYATYVRPIVNGDICTGLAFRNFSHSGGDTLTVLGVYVR